MGRAELARGNADAEPWVVESWPDGPQGPGLLALACQAPCAGMCGCNGACAGMCGCSGGGSCYWGVGAWGLPSACTRVFPCCTPGAAWVLAGCPHPQPELPGLPWAIPTPAPPPLSPPQPPAPCTPAPTAGPQPPPAGGSQAALLREQARRVCVRGRSAGHHPLCRGVRERVEAFVKAEELKACGFAVLVALGALGSNLFVGGWEAMPAQCRGATQGRLQASWSECPCPLRLDPVIAPCLGILEPSRIANRHESLCFAAASTPKR